MAIGFDETAPPLGKAIYQLVVEAQNADRQDRRSKVRHPLCRPVVITARDGRRLIGFSREISATGIGLVHQFDLPCEEVEMSISSEMGHSIRVLARIVWCKTCGDGWHSSGAKFVGKATIVP